MAKKGFFSWFRKDKHEETSVDETTIEQSTDTRVEQGSHSVEVTTETQNEIETPTAQIEQASEEPLPDAELPLTEPELEKDLEPVEQVLQEQTDTVETAEEKTQSDVNLNEETVAAETITAKEPQQATDTEQQKVDEVELHDSENEVQLAAEPLKENIPEKVEPEENPAESKGFFARLKQGLKRTSENIGDGFVGLFSGKKIDDDLFEELEEHLLIADVGVETTSKLIKSLTEQASRRQLKDAEVLHELLQKEMLEMLEPVSKPFVPENADGPFVILMVGVNGVGKTTTIGKLAKQYQRDGKSVMLAAGDTFRAAAVEQLQVWGERNQIPVIAQHTGADSASVLFDALQAAKARKIDVLIADTAGRLQNKGHLMEELKKVVRVMKKLDPDTPHEVMLTLDASTGQNAISQAQLFQEAVGVTGINISKLDGTAKGGVIFAIADKFGIPIRYIGVGEQIDDLRQFNAKDFIAALFNQDKADS